MADVEFAGEEFRPAEGGIPLASLMRFAHVAKSGTDANDLDGLDALYRLLQRSIHPEDWERFMDKAEEVNAKGDDLMKVVRSVIRDAAARPTGRSSDSSGGPIIIAPNSETDSPPAADAPHLRVIRREEESGRPDRALIVLMAQEATASTG